jgi:selenocysteine lyase/cysteine desulfurase
VTPEGREWFGWMVAVWLPPGNYSTLQQRLWQNYRIEVPIVHFSQRWLVRVSCHLYNSTADIDRLTRALSQEL